MLTDPARRTTRTPRRYLLSGLVRCAVCGKAMYSGTDSRRRRYACRATQGFAGCGRVSITAPQLETAISTAVLVRLDSPDLAAILAGKPAEADTTVTALHETIAADLARLEELAATWGEGDLTLAEWKAAKSRIDTRLATTRRQLAAARGTGTCYP
ncbi:zinc ribbon domain-containing protein [Cellulomonas triticagri]|uniref:zinc ribbon domain-containing protein n=1 Tax=Cellulomonas triticagri TaxID=2483352 RepID=UPI0011C3C99E|nr:zinc ribbon domain-containing protein [Cellulomonas triticagri]